MDDGSAIWSGAGYSAVTESGNQYGGGVFSYADYASTSRSTGANGSANHPPVGYPGASPRSYVPGGPSTYGGSYPYYANNDVSDSAQPLPPY